MIALRTSVVKHAALRAIGRAGHAEARASSLRTQHQSPFAIVRSGASNSVVRDAVWHRTPRDSLISVTRAAHLEDYFTNRGGGRPSSQSGPNPYYARGQTVSTVRHKTHDITKGTTNHGSHLLLPMKEGAAVSTDVIPRLAHVSSSQKGVPFDRRIRPPAEAPLSAGEPRRRRTFDIAVELRHHGLTMMIHHSIKAV